MERHITVEGTKATLHPWQFDQEKRKISHESSLTLIKSAIQNGYADQDSLLETLNYLWRKNGIMIMFCQNKIELELALVEMMTFLVLLNKNTPI
ncbi:hypothetical protein [Aliikangiella maris]|uniref:Uncharacterized protein n=2 Tax=Aliikangiella maris TaxID=3162458 RepID=A0ABV2BYF2_9GAMM